MFFPPNLFRSAPETTPEQLCILIFSTYIYKNGEATWRKHVGTCPQVGTSEGHWVSRDVKEALTATAAVMPVSLISARSSMVT